MKIIKKARMNKKKDRIILSFFCEDTDTFFKIVKQVKNIPSSNYAPALKRWQITPNKKNIIALSELGFDLHNNIIDYLAEEKERKRKIEKVKYTSDILFDYQIEHTQKLIHAIIKNNSALDGSDTGTGKTFCALALAKYFDVFPVVITPKAVIPSWEKVAKIFNIDLFVSNYEQYQRGNCEYIVRKDIIKILKDKDGNPLLDKDGKEQKEVSTRFKWKTNEKHIIIFDEAHKTKNYKTLNAKMLLAAKKRDSKILTLSATVGDNPLHLYAIGTILNLFTNKDEFWKWAESCGVVKTFFGFDFDNNEKNLQKLHNSLYTGKGSRISVKNLGDKFPDNLIIADPYRMDNEKEIQKIYDMMYTELTDLYKKQATDKQTLLTKMLRARQEIELLKVPTIVELAKNLIDDGKSVAIFVNFTDTLKALSKKLKSTCIIDGSITGKQRQINIDNFQADKERIIICNIKAGGVGISLHDLNGNFPRVGLISPTYSAQDLIQTLGRLPRSGALSNVIQYILFCANTIEEKIAEKVNEKMYNIKYINDGDLLDENELLFNKMEV